MASIRNHELQLVNRFVASFERLDDMIAWDTDPVATQLARGDPDQFGIKRWQPIKASINPECLEPIYAKLPARFPRLFEQLILSYRWAAVDLQSFRLTANPPGPDLSGLFEQISGDGFLWNCLLEGGYIRFGMGAGGDYDPVCFDISARKRNQDYRIVKIDHEEILCNERVKVIAALSPSFEQLMVHTIELASHT